MYSHENSFNVKDLRVSFNKKANINKIYEKIQKKYSLREITIYAFVGYHKTKKNTLLICFSNQKIFIDDEKSKVPFSGVYTYRDIKEIKYYPNPNPKNELKSYIELITENYNTFRIKGISRHEFKKIRDVFHSQKEIYLKSFLEKISLDEKKFELIDENFSYSAISNSVKNNETLENSASSQVIKEVEKIEKIKEIENFDFDDKLDESKIEVEHNETDKLLNSTLYKSLGIDSEDSISANDLISKSNLLVDSLESPTKSRKVVNDGLVSNTNSFSSSYLVKLFTNEEALLPGGKKTMIYSLLKKIKEVESKSLAINGIDTTPINLDKKVLKLNTIPVIVETKPIVSQPTNSEDDVENRLIFTRNWIEYTKHNVVNKVLGVDANGNGAYIDISKASSNSVIDTFKAREYKINDEVRSGLRSSLTIPFYEKNGRPGLDFFYNNLKTGEKLNIAKYDGILFLGTKYYFNVYNEFSKLQKKYVRIFVEDKKSNGEIFRKYELIFEDDSITYKAYNERSQMIDDTSSNSSSYDLKWLMFFKE